MNRFAVGDKAVIATDFWDRGGKVSPFRKGAVVTITGSYPSVTFPYNIAPTDGTHSLTVAKESELAPYAEPTPKFQRGDKVKVKFKAEVTAVYDGDEIQVTGAGRNVAFIRDASVVEKIEPPVETFGPGDYVRDPNTGQVFLLIKDGYVQVRPTVGRANPLDWPEGTESFTSEQYERVEYAQAPF